MKALSTNRPSPQAVLGLGLLALLTAGLPGRAGALPLPDLVGFSKRRLTHPFSGTIRDGAAHNNRRL